MDPFTYKTIDASDEALMFSLYSAVRAEELGMQEWDPAMRDPILRIQYEAQRRAYREQHPSADRRLIFRDGTAIGWVVVERTGTSLHGVDIALLAGQRSNGVGTAIIRSLQKEAAAAGGPMTIAVLRTNVRAIALYRRLGFRAVEDNETHTWMEWRNE